MNRIICGDAFTVLKTLPDESVHCVITSPPYLGLRDYGLPPTVWGGDADCEHEWDTETVATEVGKGNWAQGTNGRGEVQPGGVAAKREPIRSQASRGFCRHCGAWRGSLGLEPTVDLYVEHLVDVFCQVRRVLRRDGQLWLNVGDGYAASPCGNPEDSSTSGLTSPGRGKDYMIRSGKRNTVMPGLKPKDLMGMPWRVALTLQAHGWWLRRDIVWAKGTVTPESVQDRPTTAHEYIFMLTKSARYYYDGYAIREPASGNAHARGAGVNPKAAKWPAGWDETPGGHGSINRNGRSRRKQNPSFSAAVRALVMDRNARSVWAINPQSFRGEHYSTYPEEIPRRCIAAGTSERGCCPECGAPWERVVDVEGRTGKDWNQRPRNGMLCGNRTRHDSAPAIQRTTRGWRPTCGHYDHIYRLNERCKNARKRWRQDLAGSWWPRVRARPGHESWPVKPPVVLDPFVGSGTTLVVAQRLGRDGIGIDLNPEYTRMTGVRCDAERVRKSIGEERPQDLREQLPLFALADVEEESQ